MNGARTKLFITLGKIIIFYLLIAPWSRTKFYKLRVQKEKPAVFASHPHTVGPARRSSGNACGVAFSLTSGTVVEQTDYRAMAEKTGGRRDGCSMDSKKIGVGWDSCGWRVPYC